MKKAIEVIQLNKSFSMGDQSVAVLKDVNLSIEQGEFVSIMGPSGSGKSTLLYLLGGLDRVTSGPIHINGKELSSMSDREESVMRRQEMGFVFQLYNLIPNLNVEENVLLPILLDGKKAKGYEKKVNEILEIVGLNHHRHHKPAELSGGQQQRVAIARSLINDPQVLLADEPTGNLDHQTGLEILGLFKKINQECGITIIQVTHSNEAAAYGNRVIQLLDGKVI